jgi:hypothetical protein
MSGFATKYVNSRLEALNKSDSDQFDDLKAPKEGDQNIGFCKRHIHH